MCELVKPICLVAAARSGTNLMGHLLRRHEDIAFWYTPKYIWRHGNAWLPDDCLTAEHARPRVVRYIRRRFAEYTKNQGKTRFYENTQGNVLALPFVNAVMPDAKIIHVIRDGRDNAASQRHRFATPPVSTTKAVRQRLPGIPLTDWPAYLPEFLRIMWNRIRREKYVYTMGPKIKNWRKLRQEYDMLEYNAINWRECVTAAREFGRTLPAGRYLEVRFEKLLEQPEETAARIMEFCELPQSATVLEYARTRIDPNRKGRRAQGLSEEELKRVMMHIGDLVRELESCSAVSGSGTTA